jgi:hypothetical protein
VTASRRTGSVLAATLAFLLSALFFVVSASATTAPRWGVDSQANSSVAPGGRLLLLGAFSNLGEQPTSAAEPIVFSVSLPAGMTVVDPADPGAAAAAGNATVSQYFGFGEGVPGSVFPCTAPDGAPLTGGESGLRCEFSDEVHRSVRAEEQSAFRLPLLVQVDPGASGILTARFQASGGGAVADSTVDPTLVTEEAPRFGIAAFDGLAATGAGTAFTQAGAHPYGYSAVFDVNTHTDPTFFLGDRQPVEAPRDIFVNAPVGLVGNPGAAGRCTAGELANGTGIEVLSTCPIDSQVGMAELHFKGGLAGVERVRPQVGLWRTPLYSMIPPPGVPARFGFNILGTVVVLDAHLRSSSNYGISVSSVGAAQALAFSGFAADFWGVPTDPTHDPERSCPGIEPATINATSPYCEAEGPPRAFMRLPTHCTGPEEVSIEASSWQHPGAYDADGFPDLSDPAWATASFTTHEAPGYPASPQDPSTPWGQPVGNSGCDAIPFSPHLTVTPTTEAADSPSGLNVDLTMPQQGLEDPAPGAVAESDLRKAVVKLPAGMTVNPSGAGGLDACSSSQIGLETPLGSTPVHFSIRPARCPDASKVGTVEVNTPLLDHPLQGAVYLAKQADNPFRSLLALYLAIEDPQSGTIVKLPGRVLANEQTGRLETIFDENPQLPFEELKVDLFGGPRAALRTPPSCGTYATQATMTPWSGNADANLSSSFVVTSGPGGSPCPNGGFDPKLSAGTANPLGGSFSPFNLRLRREDGTPALGGLTATLPEGLLGKLAGIPYCPDATLAGVSGAEGTGAAQIAAPSCPAASRLGTVTVGAGAGPNPFYTQAGRADLAGPYKGAPLSLAVLTPAVAGPFDLGTVVVRNALRVDPATAKITAVSDPFPTILHGIALDLRDIRVEASRPGFTLNPTSCDPMSVDATIASATGQSAVRSEHFQVTGCDRLAFKPKLSLALKGSTKRAGHPALRATLKMPPGGANIAAASVALPHSEFLDQSHIGTVCTRVQYAAGEGGGRQCPAKSVYGHARAFSPLLDQPLEGPVYLRSSSHKLPDLVASLGGQIQVDLDGRIDSIGGGIRTTFEAVPDAPVSKFVLTMKGGKKGLLQNSTNLCKSTNKATAKFDAQNGKFADFAPALKAICSAKGGKRKHPRR